jgi:hypothetical protein
MNSMSDQWTFFPRQIGEYQGFIFFDYGIRETLNTVAPIQLLNFQIALKKPRPDGLSSDEEFSNLSVFEDALQALVQDHQSLYVGRITVAGHRNFYIYTSDSEQEWASRLNALSKDHGYRSSFCLRVDDNHDGYWKELYPTDDDWQIIMDLSVLETLDTHGDDNTISRNIDHLAFFPSQSAANQFGQWLKNKGYGLDGNEIIEDGKFCVHFSHEGSVQLLDIISHTIALRRKASELGGNYDGWGTSVCKGSAS